MKRKIMISALYALNIMLWISILGLIFIPLLYLESFSPSPLNIWHEEKSLTRLEELLNMGPRGILEDLWGEIKFKFRREFALIKGRSKSFMPKPRNMVFRCSRMEHGRRSLLKA